VFKIPGVTYLSRCLICDKIKLGDLILDQDSDFVVLVHDYPYNNGHLIITTRAHKPFSEVTVSELKRLLEITQRCIQVLSHAYKPHGFNIDIVQEPHVAIQVVPRWNGDASFVSVFHGVRVIAEPPQQTVQYLRSVLQELKIKLV